MDPGTSGGISLKNSHMVTWLIKSTEIGDTAEISDTRGCPLKCLQEPGGRNKLTGVGGAGSLPDWRRHVLSKWDGYCLAPVD